MTTPLDILIIKPGSQKQLYGTLSDFALTAIEPPLWASLHAAYLRNLGYSVDLVDAELHNWSYAETAQQIADRKPRLAMISVSGSNPSASTMNMTGAGIIAGKVKELAPDLPVALSGLHPTALPMRTMQEEVVDFIVAGEGFHTLPALLDCLKAGKEEFHAVPGLWYRDASAAGNNGGTSGEEVGKGAALGGRIVHTEPAPLWKDLSTLPMPAWDLLPIKGYRAHNWHCFDDIASRQPYAVIYSSLGCPFGCHFCCINSLFGKSGIRYRSPESVVDEIGYLVENFGVKNIKIIDEMFALKRSHVYQFCDLIIERGYDLNMWAYARVNTVDAPMLAKMKQAGINWVAYGFESGNKRVLAAADKRYDLDSLMGVVDATYKEGLYICGNYIFGLPEDDQESMQDTLDMAVEINAQWANIYSTMAFPGSPLYDQALKEGWELPATWGGYSQYSDKTLPLSTNYLTAEQVLRFRDEAFNTYYRNPAYLDMMQKTFGDDVVDHLKEMVKPQLTRFYDVK